MSVRAKFKVQRIDRSAYSRSEKDGDGVDRIVDYEMRTIVLSPVYSNEPNSENRAFWQATPTGEIKLGTINVEAAKHFEVGREYYIDFTPAL
jgi:hypothetical protein